MIMLENLVNSRALIRFISQTLLICWLPIGLAVAQNSPAGSLSNDQDELPAVETNTDSTAEAAGFTIFGEKELPIGLYITPWLNSPQELSVDRPARLLEPELKPIDREVFRRQVEYHRALTAARAAKNPAPAPTNNP